MHLFMRKEIFIGQEKELIFLLSCGTPAARRNYETEIQVKSEYFSTKKYSSYDFSVQNQGLSLDKAVRQGKTDADGNVTEIYTVPDMFKNNGVLRADFYTTVFDET